VDILTLLTNNYSLLIANEELLDQLQPVKAAFNHDTDAALACLKGTRVELLSDIRTWMHDRSDRKVYWLSRAAGTGKTTVAQSVAHMAKEAGFLCASFFFSRTTNDRSNYLGVIPTIAYQLAMDGRCRSGVCAAVAEDYDIRMQPVHTQVQALLVSVLKPLTSEGLRGLLIVLDALDECRDDANKVHGEDLVLTLQTGLRNISFAKVFLTSRQESSIKRTIAHENIAGNIRPLVLHRDVPKDTVQSDIELYFRHEFAKMRQSLKLGKRFPSEPNLHALVARADGLFIYASIAVKYIRGADGAPDLRLEALLKSEPGSTNEQYERLDGLYIYVLKKALRLGLGRPHDAELRNTLVTLVLLQEQLPVKSLATFANIKEHTCAEFLQRISAVLNYQHGSTEPVRLVHASFQAFLSDPARCIQLSEYGVHLAEDHLRMTERCLEQLNSTLRYDICRIGDPSLLNTEVLNLHARLDQHISLIVLYACRFWAVHWLAHVRAAGSACRIPQGLEKFCTEHLLHWIEVLRLTEDFYAAYGVLDKLMRAIDVRTSLLNQSRSQHLMKISGSHSSEGLFCRRTTF
jgi:hypothetical protein